MRLSERGAFKAAVCDGGYHIYPAAKIIEFIKKNLPNEDFKGDFSPRETVQKIRSVSLEGDEHTKAILKEDLDLLCSRLEKMDPNYDIEAVFEKMKTDLPKMAKLYFNIENYQPVNTQVVEYFFEGYNDLYKDGDWNAFNIDAAESKEYDVPVGIYFKRSQVAPGYPEYVVMHENVHQFTAAAGMDDVTHYYWPWILEGFADVFGYLMLYRITKDFGLITRTKNLVTEFDVLDSRKVTYHYEANIASQFISTGRLAYTKAFLKAVETYRHDFDWSAIANAVLKGKIAFEATMAGYIGSNKGRVEKELSKWEGQFCPQGEFDGDDLMILRYFSSTQPPATLNPAEYRGAVWLMSQLNENTGQHYVHTKLLPPHPPSPPHPPLSPEVRGSSPSPQPSPRRGEGLIKIQEIGTKEWNNVPKGHNAFLIDKDDIPSDLQEAADKLGNYFFVVKKEYGGKIYYDVFGGGLPYRMGTGELRCAIG